MNKMRKHPGFYLLIIAIFLIIILGIIYLFQVENKKTFVVFRYDDYSSTSNLAMESKILEIFSSHSMPITVGVIPFIVSEDGNNPSDQTLLTLGPEKIGLLKTYSDQGLVNVALHGFTHQATSTQAQTEFAGVALDLQEEQLVLGKQFLEQSLGVSINTFIPPWNSYDLTTLKALTNARFSTISASKIGDAEESSSLSFIPATSTLKDVKSSIIAASRLSYSKPLTVVLFHAYDFKEFDEIRGTITLHEFSDIVDWLSQQKNVNILTVDQATQLLPDLTARRYMMAQANPPLSTFIESTYSEEKATDFFYRESSISIGTWFLVVGFYLVICLLSAALTSLINKRVFRDRKPILNLFCIISVVATIFLIVFVFKDPYIYRKGVMLLSISLGVSIGLSILITESRKQKIDQKIDLNK